MIALKSLSNDSIIYLCWHPLSFLIQFAIILVVGMTGDFSITLDIQLLSLEALSPI